MEGICDASIPTLLDFCRREISVIRGLHENADELERTLRIIQSFLGDAHMKSITEASVKTWLNELEDAVFEADNVLDKIKYQILSEEKKRKKAVSSCFPRPSSCFPCHSSHRRQMALRIKEVDLTFKSFWQMAINLDLQRGLAAMPTATTHFSRQTDSFSNEAIFIGREDHVSNIKEMLITSTEKVVSIIIPIVGMGGLGKTALARKVFNNENIALHFEQRIWIHAPHDFDAMALFKKIFETIGGSYEGENREFLLMKLREALEHKKCLLVLDDVWNENRQKWEDFKRSWLGITSNKGNAILVTTRNTKIGSMVKTVDEIPELNLLSPDECWSIIKSKTSTSGVGNSQDAEDGGRSIAKMCKGLPLAANMIGEILSGESCHEWPSIVKNWLSSGVAGDENDILKILKLSFHHLPSPALKKCFAYCSIFPKGHLIPKNALIELFMAQGFLGTSNMEKVGEDFLQILVQNSLLVQGVRSDAFGERKYAYCESYSMHDLVHDAAASAFEHSNDISPAGREIPREKAKWLRALVHNHIDTYMDFSQFRSLHALYVTGDTRDYFAGIVSDSVRELIHLRCLYIGSRISGCMRDWIGELYHLQSLRAHSDELLSTLTDLINLRHLHVACDTKLPPHLGKLTSLQTLPYFHVRDKDGHRIEELGFLEKLKGKLDIDGLHNVRDKQESMEAGLSQKIGIVRLGLQWNASAEERLQDEAVLDGLQPHLNLEELKISGYQGNNFPEWVLKMALNKMKKITFNNCSKCEKIPSFGHLPHLKSLYLGRLEKIRSIDSSFYGTSGSTVSVFPALETLHLLDMTNLTDCGEVEISRGAEREVFPCLHFLEIGACVQLSSLPFLSMCHTLRRLKILGLEGLTCLPDSLFHNNQYLFELIISDCPKLSELPDGLYNLDYLDELEIRGCVGLKSIPYSTNDGKLPPLRSLTIHVGNSYSWKTFDGLFQLSSVCKLVLKGENLASFPDQLQHMIGLSSLNLIGFGIEEFPEWFKNFSSLKDLTLQKCEKLMHLPSVEVMQCLKNLSKLEISRCPLLKLVHPPQQSDENVHESELRKISHISYVELDTSVMRREGRYSMVIENWLNQRASTQSN